MPGTSLPDEYAIVEAACERLIPAATGTRAPPRSASPTTSTGCSARSSSIRRASGPAARSPAGSAATPAFGEFTPLGRLEELAWRTRIEGSQGIPEREFNGPVAGWQEEYRAGLAALGADFADRRPRRAGPRGSTRSRSSGRCCTSTRAKARTARPSTAATATGSAGPRSSFPGDVQPRGYTDDEVAGP